MRKVLLSKLINMKSINRGAYNKLEQYVTQSINQAPQGAQIQCVCVRRWVSLCVKGERGGTSLAARRPLVLARSPRSRSHRRCALIFTR